MAEKHRNSFYLITLIILNFGLLLSACSVAPGAEPQTPTLAVSTTPLPTPTPTLTVSTTPIPTLTPTPIVEPVLPPSVEGLAVQPPDFNLEPIEGGETFDLAAAHAVYAWYRQQEGPGMWADEAGFITDMLDYAEGMKSQGIKRIQAGSDDQTFSLLTKGSEILLDFAGDGRLRESDPGRWSKDSTPEWVDVGSPVELYIGEDGHAYIAKVDADGNVTAFLNTIGANRNNLNEQWIEIIDGYPNALWNGKEWSIEPPPQVGVIGRSHEDNSVYPLSAEEISQIPTALTAADMYRNDLGPIFESPDSEWSYLFGKIAAIRPTEATIGEVTSTAMWIAWDIPSINHEGYIRISTLISWDYFNMNAAFPAEPWQTGFALYKESGLDFRAENALDLAVQLALDQLEITRTELTLPYKRGDQWIDLILSKDNAVGQIFGSKLPATIYNRDLKRDIENPLTRYLNGEITQSDFISLTEAELIMNDGQIFISSNLVK